MEENYLFNNRLGRLNKIFMDKIINLFFTYFIHTFFDTTICFNKYAILTIGIYYVHLTTFIMILLLFVSINV